MPNPLSGKSIRLLLKIALTFGAFWLLLRHMDIAMLHDMFRRQDHAMLGVAALLIVGQIMLGGLRWRLVLTALGNGKALLSFKKALALNYICVFFNCCLPGTVGGDVVRVWMSKAEGVALPVAIHSVIIDRLIALLAIVLLIAAMLPVLADIIGLRMVIILPVILVGGIAGLVVLFNLRRLLVRFQHIRGASGVLYFIDNMALLGKHYGLSAIMLLFSVAVHVIYSLTVYVLAVSLGADITWLQCIALVPLVMLLTVIPISFGGWGLREAGMVGILGLAGVGKETALMASIQLGVIFTLISVPGGLLWLLQRKPR